MKIENQSGTELVFKIMHILVWGLFIGFAIEAGAMLTSYAVSCINPEAEKNLYKGLNLDNLRQFNFWHYTMTVSFLVALQVMKSLFCFQVIKTLSKIDLKNPFPKVVARRLEKIGYIAFGTWIVTMLMLSNEYTSLLMKITEKLHGNWLSGEFILMGGLVFIISQLVRHGVEIQSENDLTV
jgi:hypothetical protein